MHWASTLQKLPTDSQRGPDWVEGLFVPEGQLIVARHEVPGSDAETSVPEGRPKSLSVPEIFVLGTEFRHERATAR